RHGADAKTDCKGKQKALRRGNTHVPGNWKASCSSAPDADQSKRCNGEYALPGEEALLARTPVRDVHDRLAQDLDNSDKQHQCQPDRLRAEQLIATRQMAAAEPNAERGRRRWLGSHVCHTGGPFVEIRFCVSRSIALRGSPDGRVCTR